MARRTKAEADATALTVRNTAHELFSIHGYAAVGLEQVAEAAGVTRGAVYHHFGSKAGLFTAVLAQVHANVGTAVSQAADSATAATGDPWEGFEAGCRTFLEVSLSESVRRIMLLDGPAVVGWTEWRGYDAATSGHHLADALRELERAGRLVPVSVDAASALLSGAMNEAVLWVAAHPTGEHREALEEAWSTLSRLLRTLRAAPDA